MEINHTYQQTNIIEINDLSDINPVVSVCMITYNHEKFIAQAIEGVLMQQTNFPYELIIGEDCSTDKTREICLAYQKKYPSLIRLFLPEKRLGMIPNFIHSLQACRGEYIALCDGDDYWLDNKKLQIQYECLNENRERSLSIHKVKVVDLNNSSSSSTLPQIDRPPDYYTFKNILKCWDFQTSSFFFRKYENCISDLTYLLHDLPFGDVPLVYYLAFKGKVYYIDKIMSEYHKHQGGATASKGDEKENLKKSIDWDLSFLKFVDRYNVLTKNYFKKNLTKSLGVLYVKMSDKFHLLGNYSKALFYLLKVLFENPIAVYNFRRVYFVVLIKSLLRYS